MFTGIVEETGKIKKVKNGVHSAELMIQAEKIMEDIHLGDSIAVNGTCLTVTAIEGSCFWADVMHETLNRSSLAGIRAGNAVNLERAMAVGGRFGGHIVSGHIDGIGKITKIKKDDIAIWFTMTAAPAILRLIVEKGSVAVDGVSLTVAAVTNHDFCVSMIPHTLEHTIFKYKRVGDSVNLENDVIGKYVERLLYADEQGLADEGQQQDSKIAGAGRGRQQPQQNCQNSTLTREFLIKNGF